MSFNHELILYCGYELHKSKDKLGLLGWYLPWGAPAANQINDSSIGGLELTY